ncbi:cell division protein ZapE [Chitinibacteraceae bacterium HSL-7]
MALHQIPIPSEGERLSAWYERLANEPGFVADSAQAAAVARLDRLWLELVEFKKKRGRLFGKTLLPQPDVPRGVYFWGGVGRGKSLLMDAFFASLPYKRKHRLHFHHFMFEVHKALKAEQGKDDPLARVAERWARAARVLCFDEFHVSDIADAMILRRLLEHLFARGVVLVATSNYAPDNLYPNGLQRANFLPAIALIKSNMDVHELDGGNDYRMRTLTAARTYLMPHDASALTELNQLFDAMATAPDGANELRINDRKLAAARHAPGIVWFEFSVLCGEGRAQTDYLELAREFHTVIVSEIPQLSAAQSNAARRLTWLIDVLYDHRVKLIASAAVPVEQLYTEGPQSGEFFRTASRMTEMQSAEYLALPHQRVTDVLASVVET